MTTREVLRAAEIIATCRVDRLEIVLEVLKQGGISIPEEMISEYLAKKNAVEEKLTLKAKDKREAQFKDQWLETDDPVILALREAVLNGTKPADISKAAGITRTAIYDILKGKRSCRTDTIYALKHAISSLDIPYPSTTQQ